MAEVWEGLEAELGQRCVTEEVEAISDALVSVWEKVAEEGEGVAGAGCVCCCVAKGAGRSHGG